jgi:CBS domain-containing protein
MPTVSSVMTPDPASCKVDTPVRDVARLMLEYDCGQIPVLDEQGVPLGVVTDRDIALRVVARGGDGTSTAIDAMTTPIKTVRIDSDLQECLRLMEEAQVRRVPVVDAAGKLAGIVAVADIALAGRDKATADVVKQVSSPPASADA